MKAMMADWEPATHLRILCRHLAAVEKKEIRRLIVAMPPQNGKSTTTSRGFPAWYLGRNPDRQVLTITYGAELAGDFGRSVRALMQSPRHRQIFPGAAGVIKGESAAAHRFDLQGGGGYRAVGRGGPITGRGADLLLIDDPLKDFEEANSPIIRQALKDWYKSTAKTRLRPDGAIVVIQTRWHEDDLAGWLMKGQPDA